jgi:hypothetical protein
METNYQSLETHLNSLLANNTLANYEVVSLGSPQSTGTVKCFRSNENVVTITYELFRIVNDEYINEVIENYE